ncbi:acyl-CoA dehydrogenase [Microbispora bryophytorum]|uniref:acyl-CoA dehydrogenase family protein n=1 Tax=Microbispora bryophytorum TaxID=1460882 RepID=UPI00340F7C46
MSESGRTASAYHPDTYGGRAGELEHFLREAARDLRGPGEELDADPDAVSRFLHLPAVRVQQHMLTPARYAGDRDLLPSFVPAEASCAEWILAAEWLAYGDPGMTLASPGPALSTAVLRALADEAQRDWFFTKTADWPSWAFFALTEPEKGSAATELTTRLDAAPGGDGWVLTGEKMYIGNGAHARAGVVFCRRAPGPWGIEAVMVDTRDPGFHAETLPIIGLRGARISRLRFDGMYIPPERILGRDRPRSRRGLQGALQAMLWFRPSVAAFALGAGRAACDYVLEQRPALAGADRARIDGLADRIRRLRRLLHEVAAEIDAGSPNTFRVSGVKMRAAHLAEDATMLAARLLGPASLVEHPWLDKLYRDVRAFEFMEGTGNIHRRGVFQGLLRDDYLTPRDRDARPGRAVEGVM